VLGLSFLFEAISWTVAWREFARQRGAIGVFDAVTRSRDPTAFLVLFEDSAALIGIVIAFAGTLAAEWLSMPELDGVASVGIGLVLAATAALLARESKSLLIGEPAREAVVQSMLEIARQHRGVAGVGRLITVHMAPNQIVASMDIDFIDDLRASEVEALVGHLDRELTDAHPEIIALFVNPKSRCCSLDLNARSAAILELFESVPSFFSRDETHLDHRSSFEIIAGAFSTKSVPRCVRCGDPQHDRDVRLKGHHAESIIVPIGWRDCHSGDGSRSADRGLMAHQSPRILVLRPRRPRPDRHGRSFVSPG
jgi:hypothetical protein